MATVTDTINCDCHGSKYSITDGSVVNPPAPKPLPPKTIKVDGDSLTVARPAGEAQDPPKAIISLRVASRRLTSACALTLHSFRASFSFVASPLTSSGCLFA